MGRSRFFAASEVDARQIAGWLDAGATVILPTETVYGLAVKAGHTAAAQRVFELKGRPADVSLPVMVGAMAQASGLGVHFNDTARVLAERFWPGPLTIVFGFRDAGARPSWLADRTEVAVRFPALELLRNVALAAGPILVTSANAHGAGAKMVAREAADSLRGDADFVVDGGTLTPTPSTIINTRRSPAVVERMGAVTAADLREFIEDGRVIVGTECES